VEEDPQVCKRGGKNPSDKRGDQWRFSRVTRTAHPNPAPPARPANRPIANNNISSLITTDGKALGGVYNAMRQVASSLTDNATATASNGTFQPTNPFDWREDLVRIDYTINGKHSLYGRYIHDNYNLIDPFGTFSLTGVLPTTPTNACVPVIATRSEKCG